MEENHSQTDNESYSNSFDCVDFWLDKPGDTTVRPCRPSLRKHMEALRAKILAAEAVKAEQNSASNGEHS